MAGKVSEEALEDKVLKRKKSAESDKEHQSNPSKHLNHGDFATLQRTVGNHGLAQLLRQPAATGGDTAIQRKGRSRSNAISEGEAPNPANGRGRSNAIAEDRAPLAPTSRGRSNAISGGPAPFAPTGRERSNAVSGGRAPFAGRGRSNAISGGPAPFLQLEGFPKFVQQLEGQDISGTLIKNSLSKKDLVESVADAGFTATGIAVDTGSTVAGAIRGGEKIATGMSGVSDVLGTVSTSIGSVFNAINLGNSILQLKDKDSKMSIDDKLDLVSNPLALLKDGLDICNGVLSLFTTLLSGVQAAASALPLVGDIISILSAGLDIVLKGIDFIRRTIKVVTAMNLRKEIKQMWSKDRALVERWLDDAGAWPKEKEKILGSKEDRKGIKSENKLTDFVMSREKEMSLGGERSNTNQKRSAEALENLKTYLIDKELASVNKKRINRQIIPLITDAGDILADLMTIAGKTTSLITTAVGSAAAGTGAAVGAGVSLGTTIASGGIQGAGAAAKGTSWLVRNVKQQARNNGVSGTSSDKSSKNKKKNRIFIVEQMLKQAQNLPKYDPNNPEITAQYSRMEMRFEATGVDVEQMGKSSVETHIKTMYKAIKERE